MYYMYTDLAKSLFRGCVVVFVCLGEVLTRFRIYGNKRSTAHTHAHVSHPHVAVVVVTPSHIIHAQLSIGKLQFLLYVVFIIHVYMLITRYACVCLWTDINKKQAAEDGAARVKGSYTKHYDSWS